MKLRGLALVAVSLLPLLTGAPPASADTTTTTYSAPLQTAVRALPVAEENTSPYDRDRDFGDWIDADRDCRNTRHEVLASEGTEVTFSSSGCTVTGGVWHSFYDDMTYTSPDQLQIDHMVPLSEAWDSGAQTWTQARRVAFANDLDVGYALNAIESSLNQAKSDSGPEDWMPPANHCRYIEIWTALKHRWQLNVDPTEQAALVRWADACPNALIEVPVVTDTPPAPAPTEPPVVTPPPPATAATTISAPAVVRRGTRVTLSGRAQPGAHVDVYFRAAGTRVYVDRRDLVASRTGAWSTSFIANRPYAAFAKTVHGRSRVVVVRVAYATINGPARVLRGATVTLTGTARPRSRVTVYFRQAGTTGYVPRRSLVASASGTFRTRYVAGASYAYFATADRVRSAIRVTRVVAPRATLPAPRPAAPPVQPAPRPAAPRPAQPAPPSSVYYPNCDAVRRAGKAPLRRGQPGYRPGLDRDRGGPDGIACE